MAVPKQRHNSSRGNRRRHHKKETLLKLQSCPSCKNPMQSHRVCSCCGKYKGVEYVKV